MNILLQILGISCFAVLFAEASGVMSWIKRKAGPLLFALGISNTLFIGRLKPFDCPMCLSWWIGLVWFSIELRSPEAILYAAICSLLSVVISKKIYKL